MSYYAKYNGEIHFKKGSAEDIRNMIEEEPVLYILGIYDAKEPRELGTIKDENFYIIYGGDEKYHEDDIKEMLRSFAPYVEIGEIEFVGEDDSLWRFIFKDGKWYEENGLVIYDEDGGFEI